MSISVDSTAGSTNGGNQTTASCSMVIAASNEIVIAGVIDQDTTTSGGTLVGVTYNGVSMTQIGTAQSNNDGGGGNSTHSYLFGILNPPTGTSTILATRTGSNDRLTIMAASYAGVSQSVAVGSLVNAQNTNNGTSVTGTLTTPVANCWPVMVTYYRTGTPSAGTGTTIREPAQDGDGSLLCDSNAAIVSAGSTSLIINSTNSDNHGWLMVALQPVGALVANSGFFLAASM